MFPIGRQGSFSLQDTLQSDRDRLAMPFLGREVLIGFGMFIKTFPETNGLFLSRHFPKMNVPENIGTQCSNHKRSIASGSLSECKDS